jgi:hypothetical protein
VVVPVWMAFRNLNNDCNLGALLTYRIQFAAMVLVSTILMAGLHAQSDGSKRPTASAAILPPPSPLRLGQ